MYTNDIFAIRQDTRYLFAEDKNGVHTAIFYSHTANDNIAQGSQFSIFWYTKWTVSSLTGKSIILIFNCREPIGNLKINHHAVIIIPEVCELGYPYSITTSSRRHTFAEGVKAEKLMCLTSETFSTLDSKSAF